MKILYIESGTSGGGSFVSLYQHLKVINRECFHPVIVYLNNNRFIEPVKSLGIPVYVLTDWLYSNQVPSYIIRRVLLKIMVIIESYTSKFYISFLRLAHKPLVSSLERIIFKENIDIIHLNVQINRDLFGLFVAERTNVPCISHLRSMRSGGFDRYRADYANRIASMFIANSNSTKQHWRDLGIDGDKMRVVYNAINKEQIKPINIRSTWKIDKSVRFIGCVGSFAIGKGHGFLLQAFAGFVKLRSDIILLLVGDGPLKEELVRQSIKLGIRDYVIFAGYLDNVQDIIAGFDLLVLPSQTEAFGRVLLEAMQVGTPIVATNVGGIPEVVEHEYNGLLVSYGDEEGLQKALERLLTDKELRSKLIENGHQTVDRFSMKHYTDDLERIYRVVLRE